MSDTIQLDLDEAYNIANGYPTDEATIHKTVDIDREKYHMRQLVMVRQNDEWYGFEYFDALDKHGESEIGESYVNGETNKVTLYKVNETSTVSYDYKFDTKSLEDY